MNDKINKDKILKNENIIFDDYIINNATRQDANEVLALYKMQIGRAFCPWTDNYPDMQEIEFDLSRNALFVMKNKEGKIIAAISIDEDEAVSKLPYWTKQLAPGGELARLAVHPDYQNQGIARIMLLYAMRELPNRGYRSVHFLVNRLNVKALRSYDKLNFNNVGECEMFDQPFYCYEKDLANI